MTSILPTHPPCVRLRFGVGSALTPSTFRPVHSTQRQDKCLLRTFAEWPSFQSTFWQGSERDALDAGSPLQGLTPPWKVMVMSDGSVTRHLHLLTGTPITVDCLQMANIGRDHAGLPEAAQEMAGGAALVQRQVLLRHQADREPLVYACSWWKAGEVGQYLKDSSKPIWVSLSQERMELHRDIHFISLGHSSKLEELLEQNGPFWGRQYLFWHDKQPLTVIDEVFSPALDKYLGSSSPSKQPNRAC